MARDSKNDKGSVFSDLPKWPKDAKELPDAKPPREQRYQWLYVVACLGAFGGFMRGFSQAVESEDQHPFAVAVGSAIFYSLIGSFVGWLADQGRFDREQRRRRRNS